MLYYGVSHMGISGDEMVIPALRMLALYMCVHRTGIWG